MALTYSLPVAAQRGDGGWSDVPRGRGRGRYILSLARTRAMTLQLRVPVPTNAPTARISTALRLPRRFVPVTCRLRFNAFAATILGAVHTA